MKEKLVSLMGRFVLAAKGRIELSLRDIVCRFAWFREKMRKSGLASLRVSLLVAVVVPVFLACLGFYFGVQAKGVLWWIGAIISIMIAMLNSSRSAMLVLLVIFLSWLIDSFVFSYVGWDPATCHTPIAQAITEGWNPILRGTKESMRGVLTQWCNYDHMLCAPKFPHVLAALVSLGTDVFTGMIYGQVVLAVVLAASAYRFAHDQLGAAPFVSILCAALLALPTEFVHYVVYGSVDYFRYAPLLTCLIAYSNWKANKNNLGELVVSMVCLIICACSKSSGVGVMAVLGLWAIIFNWRSQCFRRVVLAAVALFFVMGAAPYFTEWIHHGSPLFPGHSFDVTQPLRDLTGDFISSRNDDARRMGWFAKVVYAWLSPDLSVCCCKWYYGDPGFNPVFRHPSMGGLGNPFRHWLWFSIAAIPFIKDRRVIRLMLAIMVLAVLMPAKYIGFYRYTPEIAVVPFLALLGLGTSFRLNFRHVGRVVQIGCFTALTYVFVISSATCLAWFRYQLALESARQAAYANLAEKCEPYRVGKIPHAAFEAVAFRRCKAAGLHMRGKYDKNAKEINFADTPSWGMAMIPDDALCMGNQRVKEVLGEFPIWHGLYSSIGKPCWVVGQFARFNWLGGDAPHVLSLRH